MKIAVLTTYFDPEENGLTRYINGLYGALLKKHPEIEVDIIAFDTLRTKKYKQRVEKWTIYRIDCIPILGRTYAIPTIKGFGQLKEIFCRNRALPCSYDILNTHTRFFLTSYYGIKFGKKYHIPVIHTEHGSGFVKHRSKIVESFAKLYDLTLGKYVLKNADLVCGVSKSACRFAESLRAKKTEVVYNGISQKFWQSKIVSPLRSLPAPYQNGTGPAGKAGGRLRGGLLKEGLGIKNTETIFTFVGRLIPEKGVQDLVEVLKDIQNTPPPCTIRYGAPPSQNSGTSPFKGEDKGSSPPYEAGEKGEVYFKSWKLLVIGDGYYQKELENLVMKYQLEDKIQFLGAKSQKEIRDILNITNLFINPSIASEGLPTTILEAAACGCRVLSSDKGGSVEVLGKENLYRAGNLSELKEKIQNHKKIPVPDVSRFDWKEISNKFYKILSFVDPR